MKRIAIVNQRYGLEVNGGSEYYARLLAEHLKDSFEVTVLTTTAKDYDTWNTYYPEGNGEINGVKVLRFPVEKPRDMRKFRIVNKLCREARRIKINLENWWLKEQGPYTPKLIEYIERSEMQYDVFIFITYLYYTTAIGLPKVAGKSILVPTAHDEPYIYFKCYEQIFRTPKGIVFLTDEEKDFVHRQFDLKQQLQDVIGIGIDLPTDILDDSIRNSEIIRFRTQYQIEQKYLVYVGRVDSGKNCEEMLAFFTRYKKKHQENDIQLVIVGQCMMDLPEMKDVHILGYVSEADKYAAIAGAEFLWLPSKFESFSIALLEGMSLGVPGIVNGNCEVLKGHCEKSKGAMWYTDYETFENTLNGYWKLSQVHMQRVCENARQYVQKYYQWTHIVEQWKNLIDRI